jgi:hypothetical protein
VSRMRQKVNPSDDLFLSLAMDGPDTTHAKGMPNTCPHLDPRLCRPSAPAQAIERARTRSLQRKPQCLQTRRVARPALAHPFPP